MKVRANLTLGVVLAVLFLCSCSSQPTPNAYLGKWQNKTDAQDTVQIAQNGESFLITASNGRTFPATLHDGILEIKGSLQTIQFTYIKASDTLLIPAAGSNAEYRRSQ